MAIYRFEAKVISRGGGRSTVASASYRTGKCVTSAAAYRAGTKLTDERTGQSFDYSKKEGVLGAEIMVPHDAPAWMAERSKLWNAVEACEKRKDAQLAKDFVIALPHEMTHDQRVALTREFVREQFTDKGFVADVAWHAPSREDSLNVHAHVMVTMRKVDGDGFSRFKERPPANDHPQKHWKQELAGLRQAWADTANKHLEAAGLVQRTVIPSSPPTVEYRLTERGRDELSADVRLRKLLFVHAAKVIGHSLLLWTQTSQLPEEACALVTLVYRSASHAP